MKIFEGSSAIHSQPPHVRAITKGPEAREVIGVSDAPDFEADEDELV